MCKFWKRMSLSRTSTKTLSRLKTTTWRKTHRPRTRAREDNPSSGWIWNWRTLFQTKTRNIVWNKFTKTSGLQSPSASLSNEPTATTMLTSPSAFSARKPTPQKMRRSSKKPLGVYSTKTSDPKASLTTWTRKDCSRNSNGREVIKSRPSKSQVPTISNFRTRAPHWWKT